MTLETIKKPNWLVVVLALINIGFVGNTFDWFKFNKELDLSDREAVLEQILEDRDYYKNGYRDCGDRLGELEREVSNLRSELVLVGALSNDLPIPMWLKDLDGRMIYLNKRYEQQFLSPLGLTAADYLGKKDSDIWPPEVAEKYRANDLKAQQSDEPVITFELIPLMGHKPERFRVVKYRRMIGSTIVGIGGFCFIVD